jgi:Uma2 family endonuclease
VSLASHIDEWISPERFVSDERRSECRHEYLGGLVFPKADSSAEHNVIAGNIAAMFHAALRGKPCRAYVIDMKVKIETAGRAIFYYPDVMISCGPLGEPRYFKTDPVVIFQVLSPETESIDRREKLFAYTALSSLQAYVLVEQERIGVTVFGRAEPGWRSEHLEKERFGAAPGIARAGTASFRSLRSSIIESSLALPNAPRNGSVQRNLSESMPRHPVSQAWRAVIRAATRPSV